MEYKMTGERWEAVMGVVRESIRNPDKTPDDVLLLALSKEELTQIFTERRIEIIRAIKNHPPGTMSQLAKSLGRELSAVERDLKILEGLGVVELEKTGREVRPSIGKEFLIIPLAEPLTLEKLSARQ